MGKYNNTGGLWIYNKKDTGEQYLKGQYNAVCPNCHHEWQEPLISFEVTRKKNPKAPDWSLAQDRPRPSSSSSQSTPEPTSSGEGGERVPF